ncbi:tetratricopeptide repeat protein [Umezawaea sp. Da 62-37]|uniref:tetratricopeptide repeat protein n=1 Tax=Umezawaea sp. Da 62-37 TaxID=3075927 RepID=UPI0028F73C71|nr:tetratricopeptide repeat protein [Umezawaea sp. Da 62-37]WNV88303.1 tetratricopeptide repeat protein [Umezawaea sp. Da 62-37]
MTRHHWLRSRHLADRARLRDGLDLPPVLAVVDAHRGLRGPYSAAGALMRAIAVDAFIRRPELAARHNIEVATVAPELAGAVPPAWATLEWTVADEERTRFYSRLHTLNIANGLAEFLKVYLDELGGPRTLVVENVHEADPTDHEFVAVLLRRTDLPNLVVVVGTGTDPVVDPRGELAISLSEVLAEHARATQATAVRPPAAEPADVPALAKAYVDSDCTSDDPALRAAYDQVEPQFRAALHDARRVDLVATGEPSWALGAITHHAALGGDPMGAGADSLKRAMGHCRKVGLYHASAEIGMRGRALVDHTTHPELWWHFTEGASTSLASVSRADEAEAIYDDARAVSDDPKLHMNLAYGSAMLYARHFTEDRRDFHRARGWMNLAIALASQLPDPKERAFHTVFSRNGLALVEVRQGKVGQALRLLEDGMAKLDDELAEGEHALHRSVLRYNRAQVFAMTGRLEEALVDYQAVADLDPGFPEHHFHVGTVLRKLDRNTEALEAFRRVLPLSPPFPEVHYNLADCLLELGDLEGALAEFDYVVQLDPRHVEAHVNRSSLRCDLGSPHAWQNTETGLLLAPANPHLLSLKARLLAEQGDPTTARALLEEVTRTNPTFAPAWAILGQLRYETADLPGALSDLTQAVSLADTPETRYNRAIVFEQSGRYTDAATDYRHVLDNSDDEDTRTRLEHCLSHA